MYVIWLFGFLSLTQKQKLNDFRSTENLFMPIFPLKTNQFLNTPMLFRLLICDIYIFTADFIIMVLQPQAEMMGIASNHSSYLLALLGIANTLGRIILGFISDKPWINRLLVYNMSLTICGIGECYTIPAPPPTQN